VYAPAGYKLVKGKSMTIGDLNMVALVGRLSRDTVLKMSTKGEPYCIIGVAVNHTVKKGDTWEESADFFNFPFFGERAQNLAPYLLKGKAVSIAGHLYVDAYKAKKGIYAINVAIDNLRLIGAPPRRKKNEEPGESGPVPGGAEEQAPGPAGPDEDIDLADFSQIELDPDLDLGGIDSGMFEGIVE
jgi:single-strand DNA-binding protein